MYNIRTENFRNAQAFVNELKKRFKDLRPFWRRVLTPLIIAEIQEIFRTEAHGTWAPLHEKYAEQKTEKRPSKTILRHDDRILNALETQGAVGNIAEFKPQYMVWGLDAEQFRQIGNGEAYPRYHEFGIGVPRRAIFDPILWTGQFERNLKSLGDKWSDHARLQAEQHYGFT